MTTIVNHTVLCSFLDYFTRNFCLTLILSDFKLFHFFNLDTVVLYFAAIEARVSPALTVWYFGEEEPTAVELSADDAIGPPDE